MPQVNFLLWVITIGIALLIINAFAQALGWW